MHQISLAVTCVFLSASIFFVSGCNTSSEVSGEVFIRTQGGMNFKLGDVTVTAYSADEVEASAQSLGVIIEDQIEESERKLKICREGLGSCSELIAEHNIDIISLLLGIGVQERFSDSYTFDSPPVRATAVATATTNSDGQYSMTLPAGRYYLMAMTNRRTLGETEFYQWLVPVESNGDKITVQLTGSNLFNLYDVELMKILP
jgi:hypothetical protein